MKLIRPAAQPVFIPSSPDIRYKKRANKLINLVSGISPVPCL